MLVIRGLFIVGLSALQIVASASCKSRRAPERTGPPIEAGSLYTVDDGEGWFRFAKILVVDDQAIHIRLYKQRFKTRPTTVDPATLDLGTVKDPDGFGMGHLPLSRKAFDAWDPVFLQRGIVEPDELEGYKEWKDAGGGLFGP
jgi:hypothetical protein